MLMDSWLLVRPPSWLLFRCSGVVSLPLLAWWQRDLTHSHVSWRSKMLTSNLQEFNARSAETTAQWASLDDSWSWEMTAARGSETTTHPYSTTTGFTKAVFQLAWPFSTHYRVHRGRVPAGVSFSTHPYPHITVSPKFWPNPISTSKSVH